MAVYDLEEQEKIDDLKAWWAAYGKYVSAAVVIFAVGFIGLQGWRWYQGTQAEKASVLYHAGDKNAAKTQLQWVIDHAGEDELKAVARFRIAQLLLDEKQYDEALKTLDAKTDEAFA